MGHLFISYSSTNADFAKELEAALEASGRLVWRDKKDILPSLAWAQEITQAINDAEAFLFIITPDALRSNPCQDELHQAATLKKRIIPILRQDVDPKVIQDAPPIPPELSTLHWVYCRQQDEFAASLRQLLLVLDTDAVYWHEAADLAVRARQWEARGRDSSLLLREKELAEARQWLIEGARRQPSPTSQQTELITVSGQAETFRQQAEARRQRRVARGFAILSVVLVVALVAAGVFGVLARIAQAQAEQNARVALSHQYAGESAAALSNHRPDLALLLAVEAAQLDKNTDTRDALVNALADNRHLEHLLPIIGEPGPEQSVSTELAYTSDGTAIFAATSDGQLLRWDVASGRPTAFALPRPKDVAFVRFLALSPDASSLAYINGDGLWLWSHFPTGTPQLLPQKPGSTLDYYNHAEALTFVSATQFAVATDVCPPSSNTSCTALRLQIWGIDDTSKPNTSFPILFSAKWDPSQPEVVAISQDGTTVALSCNACSPRQIQEWSLRMPASTPTLTHLGEHGLVVGKLVFSPNSQHLAATLCTQSPVSVSAYSDRCEAFETWDVASNARSQRTVVSTDSFSDLAFNPDGTRLITGTCPRLLDCTNTGRLGLWDGLLRTFDESRGW
jgi:WD40 repeat protein